MAISNRVLRSVAEHPWTAAQDGALALSVLSVCALLALEYDLFWFAAELSVTERRITVLEAAALTVVLGGCIGLFVYRRTQEQVADAAERSQIAAELRKLRDEASRDPLTELPNRRAVLACLDALRPPQVGCQHAFFMLDLTEFKQVNDRFGHAIGDSVLKVVAERFKRVARPTDLLARLGGDEFAVLSYDIDKARATAIGGRFVATLENRVVVDGTGHDVGVSVGVALVPQHGTHPQQIMINADVAMYRAKALGHSALVFFEAGGRDADPARCIS